MSEDPLDIRVQCQVYFSDKLVIANYYSLRAHSMAGTPQEPQYQRTPRKRLSGEERRALILRRAKQVFARSPYAEASTGELARESEVTEPVLYKHFGSKKGLFLAVLGEFGAQFLETLQERVSRRAEEDILDALAHFIDDYRAAIQADPETQRVLFQAVAESSDPEIAQCIREHNRKIYAFLHQLIARALERGDLDAAVNPDAAAWGYMSMILTFQYGLMLGLSGEVAEVQQEMSRLWLRGLRAPAS
ncbi:MAG: TetR/AcrR family transcriptional regulator [Thermogemmatispora sp.]|uniref:TetR/AcrR family transcriptional regulator n=1 Tax=Thermogemmatispora sp. TaxID=1968838 RepID=UPI0019E18EFD|nr:TetR/AcrR family transcriptional regulator [Thermogemmatispora sp.]MBE3564718.1 TetR/AcrR family transcriptional regulator [Thermogemmatispora sp.]